MYSAMIHIFNVYGNDNKIVTITNLPYNIAFNFIKKMYPYSSIGYDELNIELWVVSRYAIANNARGWKTKDTRHEGR